MSVFIESFFYVSGGICQVLITMRFNAAINIHSYCRNLSCVTDALYEAMCELRE